jgi:hypothetical protein
MEELAPIVDPLSGLGQDPRHDHATLSFDLSTFGEGRHPERLRCPDGIRRAIRTGTEKSMPASPAVRGPQALDLEPQAIDGVFQLVVFPP